MTSAESLVYYPAYCFHLSPTINRWCPLRAIDIHDLERRPGFEADNVFFSLNHPIRWVRIVGVVLAIDEFYGHRVYTVDDSTGKCVECCLDIPKPVDSRTKNSESHENDAVEPPPVAEPQNDIDIGMVAEFKGSTKIFRDQKQIHIRKMQRIRSTNQEVQFWNKIRDFRREVISQPWVLDRREVRRCKKQHMMDVDAEERKEARTKKRKDHKSDADGVNQSKERKAKVRDLRIKPAKTERLITSEDRSPVTEEQYDALGL
ncbi:uncharacterized protein F4822DRAFT_284359 [Hypoxylon trugodes]|uniref:uncharacterized protein n=1 Tax=Hypoxylon trugodes TaxID=326681 RepID=UPI00219245CC|nr:uncharacterized protein F4822DRAFT_284359 [Hypoxylon trugodes]KAI1387492.1 hypothetical protein F4822DRAFT_284359 [Hypoxylon trugodes]